MAGLLPTIQDLLRKEIDPKRRNFIIKFTSPTSPTRGNVVKSAILSGIVDPQHGNTERLHNSPPHWIQQVIDAEIHADSRLVQGAYTAMADFVESPHMDRLKLDASKFILERLDRQKWADTSLADVTPVTLADFSGSNIQLIQPKPNVEHLKGDFSEVDSETIASSLEESKTPINANK